MDPGQPLSLSPKGLVEDIGDLQMDLAQILSEPVYCDHLKGDSIFILIQKTEWIQDSL